MTSTPTPVHVAWFDLESYLAVREMLWDGHIWPESYDEWRWRFRASWHELVATGVQPVRVVVQPGPFSLWCTANGQRPTTESLAQYLRASAQGE